jgi:hypothetical protein
VTDGWTLDQLVARVAEALAADGVRAPNGRIREVPDARALRWYATIGLLDRPAGFRGRTAVYGPRHLLQAVAVKRRQAEGMALAQIQAELSGATDATLREVARVPPSLLIDRPGALPSGSAEVRSPRAPFWRAAPAPAPTPSTRAAPAPAPTPATTAAPATGPEAAAAKPAPKPAPESAPVAAPAGAEPRHLVRLGPGATLVLTSAPSAVDVADLRAAAAPLIRLLADRSPLIAEEPRHDDH